MTTLTLQSFAAATQKGTPLDPKKYEADKRYVGRHMPNAGRLEENPFSTKQVKDKVRAIAFPVGVLQALLNDCNSKGYTHFGVFFDHFNRRNETDPEHPSNPQTPRDPGGHSVGCWHGVALFPLPFTANINDLDDSAVLADIGNSIVDSGYAGGTPIPPPPN